MKFLLVGCGSIGQKHLRNLNKYDKNAEFYVCDPDLSRVKQISTEVNVSKSFSSVEEVGDDLFDGILICSPSSMHVDAARKLVKNSKALFIEKPISSSLDGIDELIKECRNNKTNTVVGMTYRFNTAILKIKELIENGTLGNIYAADICIGQFLPTWHPGRDYTTEYTAKSSQGGGVLLTTGSHALDMIEFLFGEISGHKFYMNKVSELNIDVDDFSGGIVMTKSNVHVLCQFDFLHVPKTSKISITGSKNKLYCDLIKEEIIVTNGIVEDKMRFPNSLVDMYDNEICHFIQVAKGSPSVCRFEDGKINLAHLLDIKKSCRWEK